MPAIPTDFVPLALDATRWEAVEPYFQSLQTRPVGSPADLEKWLIDRSELEASCQQAESILYINMTCHTEDKGAQAAWTRYLEDTQPRLKPAAFELDKRQDEMLKRLGLVQRAGGRYRVLARDTAAEVELFRPENVPLQTDLAKLDQKYQQITGAMTVQFDGREQTMPMMGKYQESTDRGVREAAWRGVGERRLRDAAEIDGIYDEMVALRQKVAENAGFRDYVGYAFKSKRRFDYGPAECFRFHEAVEKVVVPFMRRQDARRAELLGLGGAASRSASSLRPWDLIVDPKGREPLRPFEGGRDLVRKSRATFDRLDPQLAGMFAGLGDGASGNGAAGGACLDLDSRKGKAPGGYQSMRDRDRKPFIFMNAAGLHRDVETMVHEAGHAFHSMLAIDEPLLHYRHAPLEFCEVASMSMELLTMPYWGDPAGFYPTREDADRARRRQIEGSVSMLPWIATIDAFQHWVYTNPRHTREARTAQWLALDTRFGHAVSWDGLEPFRASTWQRQLHLFGVPFYYIEYGIAQLGALQLWVSSLEQGQAAAIAAYKKGLSLGGSRPLPDLFAGAGLKFDFGPEIVGRLVDRVEKELAKLPE
ncbi:MAG: M3 family oligoendopeptidase [Phycisphaerales bacterium]|nr:M3 family oligoendopeptidase [Phycisphaerales bacterium]